MEENTQVADDAVYALAKAALRKAAVDVPGIFGSVWDKTGDDELASAISTLARLKVMESAVLVSLLAEDAIGEPVTRRLRDALSAATAEHLLENGACTEEEIKSIYHEVDMKSFKQDQTDLGKAAKDLEDSLRQAPKSKG